MRRIVQGKRGVTVHSDRVNVKAKRVIVAVPPILTGKIDYEPGLPDSRVELIDHFPQGTLTKAACVYDTPFWRDDGLSGQVLFDQGPISATFDDSPEDGSKGVVFGFVGGDQARSFAKLSPKARRRAIVDNYVNFFGPAAAKPSRYVETIWKTRGVDPRLSRRDPGARPTRRQRPGAAQAGGPHPLGGHGDLQLLGGLYGRRGPLGRASRRRGDGPPVGLRCG